MSAESSVRIADADILAVIGRTLRWQLVAIVYQRFYRKSNCKGCKHKTGILHQGIASKEPVKMLMNGLYKTDELVTSFDVAQGCVIICEKIRLFVQKTLI